MTGKDIHRTVLLEKVEWKDYLKKNRKFMEEM
jgi:hypothetical protein